MRSHATDSAFIGSISIYTLSAGLLTHSSDAGMRLLIFHSRNTMDLATSSLLTVTGSFRSFT